ncbi:MAG: hypothetical protein BWY31_03321 [Lentisphaerae bacterium ADurb.Bin242]|nr:MAG: hypothetical protein BWY31_03321 [Lentisphaerae bacterium ADurb.Bin242]
MKKILSFSLTVICLTGIQTYGDASKTLDPGGRTAMDFFYVANQRQTEERKKEKGGNIFPLDKKTWMMSFGCNQGSVQWNKEWDQKELEMRKLVKNEIREENGKTVYYMETPVEINQYRTDRFLPHVNHYLLPRGSRSQNPIKVKANSKYELVFLLKGFKENADSHFYVSVQYYDANWKQAPIPTYHRVELTPTRQEQKVTFYTGPKTENIWILFALSGCGSAEIVPVSLMECSTPDGYTMILYPMGLLDNQYHLASGQVNHITFVRRNESRKQPEKPLMKLTLPKEIKLLDVAKWAQPYKDVTDEYPSADGSRTYIFNVMWYEAVKNVEAITDFIGTYSVQIAVTSDLPAGEKLYPVKYQALADNYVPPEKTCFFKIIPAATGLRPKYFISGIYDCRNTLASQEVFEKFADEYSGMGFNGFYNFHCEKYVTDAMKKHKIMRFTNGPLHDGYLGYLPPERRPRYTHFIGVDGKPAIPMAYCPTTVYFRTDFYRNEILSSAKKEIADQDEREFYMNNWEPNYEQSASGCYCRNCKKEFLKFTKLPAAEVEKYWPREIILQYRKQWFEFKSRQHGMYLSTFENDLKEIAKRVGKNSGFIPMISMSLMLDSEFNLTDEQAFAVRFYADKLEWINPWGPYIGQWWATIQKELPGRHLPQLTSARSVVRYLDVVVKDQAKRPKLMGFPLGACDNTLTSPEELAMDTLSIYVAGWQASFPYYFPVGYDARYWKALADCNTVIAKTERFVVEGKRVSEASAAVITPFPPAIYSEVNKPNSPISSLQLDAFQNGKEYLFAVANFWDDGEAFFKLTMKGLPGIQKYSVHELTTDTRYCADNLTGFTGKELSEGVILYIGALRWAFFVLAPENGKMENAISRTEVSRIMEQHIPMIAKANEEAKKRVYNSLPPVEKKTDFSKLSDLCNDSVSFKKKETTQSRVVERINVDSLPGSDSSKSDICLMATGGNSQWEVNISNGIFITSWLFNGKQLSFANQKYGLALDGPWIPASLITRPYEFIKTEKIKGGLAIEFKRILNLNDGRAMDKIVLNKRLEFTADQVKIVSKLSNPYSETLRFAYRYQNVPGLLQNISANVPGTAELAGENSPIIFKRDYKHTFFRMKGVPENPAITRFIPDALKNIRTITKPEVTFYSSDGKTKLRMSVAPVSDFHGFACFDNQRLITFEPIFNLRELPIGQHWTCSITFHAFGNHE